ncbi:MAG: acetyl-CoA carboxylase biotin carboxyl carrier protein subunit [Albimonas sp.]|uniref:acetyl-CoA carboxylase biotin carboxyl carrier protein subunit n=1 Tax=Albimonas sp. TaxID=1872425 RepID=UPI0040570E88
MEAKSEIAGRVLELVASPGQQLAEDDPIVVLESMKMEIAVTAPRAGTLREIKVAVDEMVEEDQVVALMDPA